MLVVAAASTVAAADPHRDRGAIVAIDLGRDVPSYLRDAAAESIEQGLTAAGYDLLPSGQVTIPRQFASCREGPCLHELGGALHLDALVLAQIRKSEENTIIDIQLVDVPTIAVVAKVHDECDVCGVSEIQERVALAASALRSQLETRARASATERCENEDRDTAHDWIIDHARETWRLGRRAVTRTHPSITRRGAHGAMRQRPRVCLPSWKSAAAVSSITRARASPSNRVPFKLAVSTRSTRSSIWISSACTRDSERSSTIAAVSQRA